MSPHVCFVCMYVMPGRAYRHELYLYLIIIFFQGTRGTGLGGAVAPTKSYEGDTAPQNSLSTPMRARSGRGEEGGKILLQDIFGGRAPDTSNFGLQLLPRPPKQNELPPPLKGSTRMTHSYPYQLFPNNFKIRSASYSFNRTFSTSFRLAPLILYICCLKIINNDKIHFFKSRSARSLVCIIHHGRH